MNTNKSFVIAATVLLLAACQSKEISITLDDVNDEQNVKAGIPAPDITAIQEVQNNTKSTLEVDGLGVGTIYWTPADEINVFYGTTSTHYTSQNAVNATTAVFTTSDIIGISEGASENIWGLYPYNSSATCTGSAVTTTLPAAQYGVAGTFDDDLYITLAHNNSTALTFYNVCGGIKFSLSRDDITQVTFQGNNDEDIAGDIVLSFVGDLPSVNVTNGVKKIILEPKSGGAFESGDSYYMILLPTVLANGFTMTFETNTGYLGTFNYSSKSIEIKRSIFSKKTNIDTYASFVPNPVVNLSAGGNANCYIVSSAGTYKFKAVQGNSNTSVGDVQGVRVLWESFGTDTAPEVGDIIKADVSYSDDYVTFHTNDTFNEGNAVIAAYSDSECTDGNVLWSWHIWCTDVPEEQEYKNNAGVMMDRNIGATSSSIKDICSSGLLFQWGRKDPLLGSLADVWGYNKIAYSGPDFVIVRSDETTGTIPYSIKHPTTAISYSDPNTNYDWYYTGTTECDNTRWTSTKTIYDPCPAGWRVPDGIGNSVWEKANGSSTFNKSDFVYYSYSSGGSSGRPGWDCSEKFDKYFGYYTIWYPFTGYGGTVLPGEYGVSSGNELGKYWTCTPLGPDYYGYENASVFWMGTDSVRMNYEFRYRSCAVRCQKI